MEIAIKKQCSEELQEIRGKTEQDAKQKIRRYLQTEGLFHSEKNRGRGPQRPI